MKITMTDLLDYTLYRDGEEYGRVAEVMLEPDSLQVRAILYSRSDKKYPGLYSASPDVLVKPDTLRKTITMSETVVDPGHEAAPHAAAKRTSSIKRFVLNLLHADRSVDEDVAAVYGAPNTLRAFVRKCKCLPLRSLIGTAVVHGETPVAEFRDLIVDTVSWQTAGSVIAHGSFFNRREILLPGSNEPQWEPHGSVWQTKLDDSDLLRLETFEPTKAAGERVMVCRYDYHGHPIL